MRRRFTTIAVTTLLLAASGAFAEPTVDLVPTRIMFRVGLDDDVSGSTSQHVYAYFRNQGNVRTAPNRMAVRLNSLLLRAPVYGPDADGGGLGGTIDPGEEGKAFLRLPLGTLRHCQSVPVHIDVDRRLQIGLYNVFANDQKTLRALEFGNRRLCVRVPIPVTVPAPAEL